MFDWSLKNWNAEVRVCIECGRKFGRRTYANGAKEKMDRFNDREFCSNTCKGMKERNPKVEWRPTGRTCQGCGNEIMHKYVEGVCEFGKWLYCYNESCQDKWKKLCDGYNERGEGE